MVKTKWLIEPSKLTIYPKRALRLVGIIFFIIMFAIIVCLFKLQQETMFSTSLLFSTFLLAVPLILALIGETSLVFDGNSRKLYRKISMIPIGTIPFDDIAAVEPYEILGSGFNYRLFKKSDRHGKGIIISAGYNKGTNTNFLDFQNQVLPKIDELVFANAPAEIKQTIYDFEFFKERGGVYTIRDNKVGALIIGVIMVGITVAILLNPNFMRNENDFSKILLTFFPLVIGVVFISTFFTKLFFDKNQGKIIHSTFAGRITKEYAFDDLIQFQIVRKSVNFIYAGTEVRAQIDMRKNNKVKALILKSFRGTKKIERFLDEANTILGRL